MISRSLYGILLNPEIGKEVVNNSDLLCVASHSNNSFPFCNFFNLTFLSESLVFENLPILTPISIPNSMTFFALSSVFLYYYLSVHNMRFILIFVVFTILQAGLIIMFHSSLLQVLYILCFCSVILFIVNLLGIKKVEKIS